MASIGFINKKSSGIDTSDATAVASDLVLNKVAYAKGEKLIGTLNPVDIKEYIAEENINSSTTYNLIAQIKKLNRVDLTGVKYMIDSFRGANSLQRIEEIINTESVISTNGAFTSCHKLEVAPDFNTENVSDMTYMFAYCEKLKTIPVYNTSKVTKMSGMFNGCKGLEEAPLFNTSSVKNMSNMFTDCEKLKSAPNYDTAKVTNMQYMFFSCVELETIPAYDTTSLTNMINMVGNCPLLSADSLNNILSMYINASAYTRTKSLKDAGLTEEQANACKELSNWAAFEAAGGVTGY